MVTLQFLDENYVLEDGELTGPDGEDLEILQNIVEKSDYLPSDPDPDLTAAKELETIGVVIIRNDPPATIRNRVY